METDKNDELIKPAACAANFPVSYITQQLMNMNIATTAGVNPFGCGTANQDLELVHGEVNTVSADGVVKDAKIQPDVSPNAPKNKPEVARFVGNNQGEIIDVGVLHGGSNLAARDCGTCTFQPGNL